MTEAQAPSPVTDTGVRDRELDPPSTPVPRRARGGSLEPYQRLVANPFLALLGLVVWFALWRYALHARRVGLFFGALASGVLVVYLFQYHCLDCGATGRLSRWRAHCCSAVETRLRLGRRRRLRGPSPTTQTVLWFYVVLFAGLMFVLGRR